MGQSTPPPGIDRGARTLQVFLLGSLCACSWNWREGQPDAVVDADVGEVLSFQLGVVPSAGFRGAADTYLNAEGPDTPHGSSDILQAADDRTALVYWDVSEIASDREVLAARVTFFATDNGDSYNLVAAKRPWKAAEATWNEYALGEMWESPGGLGGADSGTDVLARVDPPVTDDFYVITLAKAGVDLVQTWIREPTQNFGLMLIAPNQGSTNLDGIRVASNEAIIVDQRPKLSITLR